MFDLIKDTELEIVYGEKVSYINIFSEGNYGSPVIEGFLKSNEKIWVDKQKNIYSHKLIPYFLFYCRKKKDKNHIIQPLNENYDYYLIFAVEINESYEIKGIYEHSFEGLQGYYWEGRDEWKERYKSKSWLEIATEAGWKQGQPKGPHSD